MAQGNYANVNGIKMYYEVHGTGSPLILIHGGYGVISMFGELLTALARDRQVVAVELQGHGHTADIDRPFSFESLADDIFALISQLGFEKADILGYSLGGGVALQTAIRHPESVRKLVIVSAPCKSDGWYPDVRAGMRMNNAETAKTWIGSPMHQTYVNVAPDPNGWFALADKTGQLLSNDYDWSMDVKKIKLPVFIVAGDADSIRPSHFAKFFGLLGGGKKDAGWDGSGMPTSRLAILPATTHYNSFSSPLLAQITVSFLNAT